MSAGRSADANQSLLNLLRNSARKSGRTGRRSGESLEPDLDTAAVRDLLPEVDLDFSDERSLSWLHWLVSARPSEAQLEIAREMCRLVKVRAAKQSAGALCLYRRSKAGNDPVTLVARNGCSGAEQKFLVELVKLLLDTDGVLLARYASNRVGAQTDLMESVTVGGSEKLIEYLADRFEWKADNGLARIRVSGGCSLPQVAAATGHRHLLEWFSEQGTWHSIPLNLEDNDGETGLSDAAAYGHDAAVQYLIACGDCNIDHRSRLGDTPLFRALKNDRFETAQILLESGADAKVRDFAGNSAVHAALQGPEKEKKTAVGKGEYLQILRTLKKYTAMNSENLAGYSPLHACVESRNWTGLAAAVELLGRSESALVSSSGLSVLHVFFCFHSDEEDRRELESILGPSLWVKLLRGRATKAVTKRPRKKDPLLGHRGDDRAGYNCLHFACDFDNKKSFYYLVKEVGFQFSDRTATGKSAVDLLLRRNSFDDVKHLFKMQSQSQESNELSTSEHLQLCSLIDPLRAASATLQKEFPKGLVNRLLRLCADEMERGELLRFHTTSLSSFKSGRVSLARGGQESVEIPLGVKLLMRCINEDDSEGVQSLATLGLLDSMWDANFMNDAANFWMVHNQELKNIRCKCKCNPAPDKCPVCQPADLIEFCQLHGRHSACLELLRYRQFDLVPTCLRFIVKCNEDIAGTPDLGRRETLRKQRDSAKNILLNSLNCLDDEVSENDAKLVENYLEGRIAGGPRYSDFGGDQAGDDELTIAQLLETSGVEEALATSCVRRLVENAWVTDAGSSCSGWSPQVKFALHILTYLIFTVCFTVFITMGDTCYSLKTSGGRALYTILTQFSLDFIVMDAVSVSTGRPEFWRIVRWALKFLGSLFLLAGLIGVPIAEFVPEFRDSEQVRYGVYMCLATAYLLMSFRWLKFFKWFNIIGPTVGTIERLLAHDLLPFLLIFLVFIVAFGVFFQVLLYPGRQVFQFVTNASQPVSVADVIVSIYSRPLLLTFGEIEIDSLRQCTMGQTCSNLKGTDCSCPYSQGIRAYLAVFGFVFMILNLALLNLLIAKFSLTVNTSVRRAFVTWSSYRFQLLREFQRLPPAPPPYSWLSGLLRRGFGRRTNNVGDCECIGKQWWRAADPQQLPEAHMRFLWFQARKYRGKRAQFLQPALFPDADAQDADALLHGSCRRETRAAASCCCRAATEDATV